MKINILYSVLYQNMLALADFVGVCMCLCKFLTNPVVGVDSGFVRWASPRGQGLFLLRV